MLADTKPKTETEKLFALDKPSLENLSYCLRHPETWPEGFIWNYNHCDHCAMGLAHSLWKSIPAVDRKTGASIMARSFAIPFETSSSIFMGTAGQFAADWIPIKTERKWFQVSQSSDGAAVSPEMVADQIDKYLSSSK